MVFYHTSENVKIIRNIFLDYNATDISPKEYMEFYIEKCPETTSNMKLQWIVETFMGIQKHLSFLNDISAYFSNELTDEEQDYFMIYFHSVIFQIKPYNHNSLYKSIFNLNKTILCYFIKFLSNNENLNVVTQISENSYDTTYTVDVIIGPLFEWQPYISEMEHSFEEYSHKMHSRNIKPLTVPMPPKCSLQKPRDTTVKVITETPALSQPVRKINKLLSKSVIDERIKIEKSNNSDKAKRLLREVNKHNFHFAQGKSEKYLKKMQSIQDERDNFIKTLPKTSKKPNVPIAHVTNTVTSIKRVNMCVHALEEREIKWLKHILQNCENPAIIDELQGNFKSEIEKEKIEDVQRKHLLGQISFEEALLAKQNVLVKNKKKYEEFLKEREVWNEQIKTWHEAEIEKNKKNLEKMSLQELNLIKNKNDMIMKKKLDANNIKQKSDRLRAQIIKENNEVMLQKIRMIKEIKIISILAKKSKVPKIIDLTQTSGLGLLCEMSLAEVQERLGILKINLKEELDAKQKQIKDEKFNTQKSIEKINEENLNYLLEKAELRKINKARSEQRKSSKVSKEISDLQHILDEKRKQRLFIKKK